MQQIVVDSNSMPMLFKVSKTNHQNQKATQEEFVETVKDDPSESQPFAQAEKVIKQADTESPIAADISTSNSPRKSATIPAAKCKLGRNRRRKK